LESDDYFRPTYGLIGTSKIDYLSLDLLQKAAEKAAGRGDGGEGGVGIELYINAYREPDIQILDILCALIFSNLGGYPWSRPSSSCGRYGDSNADIILRPLCLALDKTSEVA